MAAICLSAAFFFAEFTIGPMWAIPMDIAPKYAGTASGLMNTGSALAAIVSPVIAGYVIDKTGIWELPFIGSIALLLLGSMLAFRMRPDEELDVPLAGVQASARPRCDTAAGHCHFPQALTPSRSIPSHALPISSAG